MVVADARSVPAYRQVVLDTTDARGLAEFYRKLLGFEYCAGDEPPAEDQTDARGHDWLVIQHPSGAPRIAFQQVAVLRTSSWPQAEVPQQLHLDLSVPTAGELDLQHERALELGAALLQDRADHAEEPLRVYADPAGHPFCIFVASA
ncbi:MAG: VOC family protein [Chloroflexi bacterium]|nr:VOC family protein [Chloroflexota bacterium]